MNLFLFLSFIKHTKSQDTPTFFDKAQQSLRLSQIDSRINNDTKISTTVSNAYRGDYDFYYCSVTVKSSTFKFCYAFGSNIAGPNGGAMYFFASTVEIQYTGFKGNEAADGGAICFIQSNAFLHTKISDTENPATSRNILEDSTNKDTFQENKAYYAGGAILFEGSTKGEHKLYIYDYKFLNNKAQQTGGAIQIELQSNAYLEGITIQGNEAVDNGAAIYAKDTHLSVFNSFVYANKAGEKLSTEIKGEAVDSSKYESNPKRLILKGEEVVVAEEEDLQTRVLNSEKNYDVRFAGRGCGGIAFLSSLKIQGNKRVHNAIPFFLTTQGTCFAYNQMFRGITKPLESTSTHTDYGNDVLLENDVKWESFKDHFQNSITAWAYIGNDEAMDVKVYKPEHANETSCDFTGITDNLRIIKTDKLNISYASKSNTGEEKAENLSPTPYTYQATPITRLPEKTTSSFISKSANSKMFSNLIQSISTITPGNIPLQSLAPKLSVYTLEPPKPLVIITDSKYTYTNTMTLAQTLKMTKLTSYTYTNHDYSPIVVDWNTIEYIETETTITTIAPKIEVTKVSTLSETFINTSTVTFVNSITETNTLSNTTTTQEETTTSTQISIKTFVEILVKTKTFIMASTLTETEIFVPLEDQTTGKALPASTVILLAVIGCVVVFALAILGLFLYRKTHQDSSGSGSESLEEDPDFGDETKISNQVVEFTEDDEEKMLSTFNGTEIQDAPDEDEIFLNGEF